jgi:hypothetical protein
MISIDNLHDILFQTMYPPCWGVWDDEIRQFFAQIQALAGTRAETADEHR